MPRSWLPRLTRGAMRDLQIWMAGFGLLIGILFPFAVIPLGVPSDVALRPQFFLATVLAGLVVAAVNYRLAHAVVGVRLRALAAGMRHVEESLKSASHTGDWGACNPADCKVAVDSDDELGEAAASFNRLVDSLAQSNRLTQGVAAMSEALASQLELAALAESALTELAQRTGYEAAALLVVRGGVVEVAGSYGISDAVALTDSEVVRTTLRTERPTVLELPPGVAISGGLVDITPQEVRVLPVRYGIVTLGVLVLASVQRSSDEDITIVQSSLPGTAVALNNALSHENLQRVAALDPLTGILNRRFGMQRLHEEFARAMRSNEPVGLLMFDIDHFKNVNDTYGHLVGDQVLKSVVTAARRVLREGDVAARYGGEEFMVVLPGAGRADAEMMAERIRRAVAAAEVNDDGVRIVVTVSVGGTTLSGAAVSDPDDFLRRADAALYSAKASGRDCTVVV